MKVTTLGKYGRFAPPNNATNGYLLEKNGKKIIIDFGSGCLSRILSYSDMTDIDAIIISHLHYDHMSDLYTLGYYLMYNKITIDIYLPASPKLIVESLLFCSYWKIHTFDNKDRLNIGGMTIIPYVAPHSIECYSLLIDKLLYTSDIKSTENITIPLSTCSAVIGDCCMLAREVDSRSPHIAVEKLALSVGVETVLYLSHLDYKREDILLEAAQSCHNNSMIVPDSFEVE